MSAVPGRPQVDHAVQKAQETTFESESRQAADFPKIEQLINFKRFSPVELGAIDRITGLLGAKNPFSKKAKAGDNEVWLLDNTAYKQSTHWEAEFVACFFQKGRKDITEAVSQIADAIGLDGKVGSNEEVRKVIAQRLQPFISPIAPARTINVSIPLQGSQSHEQTLGPSDGNGISSQDISIGVDDSVNGTTVTSTNSGPKFPSVSGKTRFAGPEGWGIISDIDDTIKVTQTSTPVGILRTTFVEEPQTTNGMPEFYKVLHDQFSNPAWFYLSASPYNLYPFLRDFLTNNYPAGTIILRDASWMFFGGLLQSLTQGVQAYKTDRMRKINGWLPGRKMICVGDSTQLDPESYAEIYKQYPGWIKAIYIRKVLDVPFLEKKNMDERFTKAFEGVPSNVWKVFVDPTEVADHLKQIAGNEGLQIVEALQRW